MPAAFLTFAVGVATAVVAALLPAAAIEWWARAILPHWATVTTSLQSLVEASLTLIVAAAALAALIVAVARTPRGRRLRRGAVLLLGATGLLGATFVLAWGAAYHRLGLADHLGLDERGADLATLENALERLVAEVHANAPEAPLQGLTAADRADAARIAAACVADADEVVVGRRVAVPARVRDLPPGSLLRSGFGGISLPWLLEPHIDAGLPGAAWLAVATHELTHAVGWAREADTDALSVLAGLACGSSAVRYAVAIHGAQLVAAAIAAVTPPEHPARARVADAFATLPEVARLDRRAMADAVARHLSPVAAETVGRVYDTYLRSQGVAAGIADYALAAGILASALGDCPTTPPAGREDAPGAALPPPWCPA